MSPGVFSSLFGAAVGKINVSKIKMWSRMSNDVRLSNYIIWILRPSINNKDT